MDNVVLVQVADGFEHFAHHLRGILLRELSILANPVEQLASGSKLGYDVVFVLADVSDRCQGLN